MTQAAIIQAIRDRFDTLVATPNSLRVIHDNAKEPDTRVQSWCRFSVQVDTTNQVSMGQVRYRSRGFATALIFTPIGKGDASALALCQLVIAAFQGLRVASPQIAFEPSPTIIGVAEQDEAWCRRTVRIPFRADVVIA
jgi:hypothetical protein